MDSEEGQTLMVQSRRESHFYVGMNRSDSSFREKPDVSSFPFTPGRAVRVVIDHLVEGELDVSFTIVEYSSEASEAHFYSSNVFLHEFSEKTVAFSLAARVKGMGRVQLGPVETIELRPVKNFSREYDIADADRVDLQFSAWGTEEADNAALVSFLFTDSRGNPLIPHADVAIHPKKGLYRYISTGSGSSNARTSAVTLHVPSGATKLSVTGAKWRKEVDVYLVDEPTVEYHVEAAVEGNAETIEKFVAGIPADDALIVLYTTAPQLGHPTLALRPNRLAKEYLEMGFWVVFFPFSKVPEGESYQGERARQYSRERLHEFLAVAARRPGSSSVFVCSSFPDIAAATAIDQLKLHGWRTTYEVRDDMEEFNRVGYSKWFSPQLERRVCESVDTVITVSPRLASKMDVLRACPGYATVVPNAVNQGFIDDAKTNRTADSYAKRSRQRTVGYIGHLTPSWFDWSLVIGAAERLSDVTFEIIGHGKPDNLRLPANVIFHGPKTHSEFQNIAADWKVGLIPFKPSTLTFAVDPNKVYEYLAVGLRVVTAPMGSVADCPSTFIYDHRANFEESILQALDGPIEPREQEGIERFLEMSSWRARAEKMVELMGLSK